MSNRKWVRQIEVEGMLPDDPNDPLLAEPSTVPDPTLPSAFGYYWVTKKPGEDPVLLYLCPSKQYDADKRSVEAWDCPGIRRYRLDTLNMPEWTWTPVVPPNTVKQGNPT